MKYMKKYVVPIVALILLDQGIKQLIRFSCMDTSIVLIPHVFWFEPFINIRLSWGGTFLSFMSNPWLLYTINLAGFFLAIVLYRFYLARIHKQSKLNYVSFVIVMAGMVCSFIDKLQGGSLDYIRLFHWFTFDLKDCYLSGFDVLFVLSFITNNKNREEWSLKNIYHYGIRGETSQSDNKNTKE